MIVNVGDKVTLKKFTEVDDTYGPTINFLMEPLFGQTFEVLSYSNNLEVVRFKEHPWVWSSNWLVDMPVLDLTGVYNAKT